MAHLVLRSSVGTDEQATLPSKHPDQPALVPAIELDHLCKRFGTREAVAQLSLTIAQGEIFGIIGPNGSGKTTTINMLCGLSAPTSGSIRVLGYELPRQARRVRQLLGVVPQETALYEKLSAYDNLDVHAKLFGLPRKERRARIVEILDLVQLTDRQHSLVGTFSGGMKRRLALGRALLHRPRLIILDEPTLGVDPQARQAILEHILALRELGITTLLTTNYLQEAQLLCDRLAIIDHGKLVVVGTPARLRQEYGGSQITVELAENLPMELDELRVLPGVSKATQSGSSITIHTHGSTTPLAAIVALLAQQGEIRDVTLHESDLDAVFLRLTGAALRD